MIVIDTSAIMAIVLHEPVGLRCMEVFENADAMSISAGTLSETLLVAERRAVRAHVQRMVDELEIAVIEVTALRAQRVADAFARWGKGAHPAALNFGDCFAYAVAAELGCPLLFVGDDFAKTDIASALSGKPIGTPPRGKTSRGPRRAKRRPS